MQFKLQLIYRVLVVTKTGKLILHLSVAGPLDAPLGCYGKVGHDLLYTNLTCIQEKTFASECGHFQETRVKPANRLVWVVS